MVMAGNKVQDINFKGHTVDTAHANWNAIKKLYSEGDLGLPVVGRERTYHFHLSRSLD
jgi:hypothetical protein